MRPFKQVDVFTATPYRGNPLAVVLEGEGLTVEEMHRFANWTNLSETTFLLPPTDPAADYRVRIFTTEVEYPFAGHPTIGSCHAWLEAGGVPKTDGVVVQECGAGLVPIRRDVGLAFAAPPLIRSGPIDDADMDMVCAVLRIARDEIVDAAWADNGPGWLAVQLADADAVLAIDPDFGAAHHFDIGLAGLHPPGGDADLEVRAVFRTNGGPGVEDPVTGSLNASLAQWLLGRGVLEAPYTAAQGRSIGRDGRVRVSQADGEIWVGGDAVTCIDGEVDL